MKRLVLLSTLIALFFAAPSVHAQQRYALGFGNVALKVDYFRFTDGDMEDLHLENGVYIGLEAYLSVLMPNLYLGLESGWAGTSSDSAVWDSSGQWTKTDTEADYVPIELNTKYVFPIDPALSCDVGAGLSVNYFNIDLESGTFSGGDNDWLFGAQLFADLNYQMSQWFAGVNVKYQITDELEIKDMNTDVSASNFRAGAQLGFQF